MDIKELQSYVDDFLSGLDGRTMEEWYDTEASLYSSALTAFMDYVRVEYARNERRKLYEQLKAEFDPEV